MKIGLVLSGGAARSITHLGIYKALLEMGVKASIFSGSSGGALFGIGLAAGFTPEETLEKVMRIGSVKWFFPSLKSGGLFSLSRIEDALKTELPVTQLEELSIPFVVCTTDMLNGVPVYFSKGEIVPAILASCSYPAIFEPIDYQGYTLLDGGIINNMPYEPLIDKCDKIIGLSTGSGHVIPEVGSVQQTFIRALGLAISEHDKHRFSQCDLIIEPPNLHEFGMFEGGRGKEIFEIGYNHALSMRSEVEDLLA